MNIIFVKIGIAVSLVAQILGQGNIYHAPASESTEGTLISDDMSKYTVVSTESADRNIVDLLDDTQISEESTTAVLVWIGGFLAGELINGVIYYYSGYSLAELCAQGLRYLDSLCYANRNINGVRFDSPNSTTASSYTTNDGNECVRVSGGSYACKFAVRETE